MKVTDLLLQAGGFGAIVLDMGAWRRSMCHGFRWRRGFGTGLAAERTQACVLLLTQHACAKSSAGLVLRMEAGEAREQGGDGAGGV